MNRREALRRLAVGTLAAPAVAKAVGRPRPPRLLGGSVTVSWFESRNGGDTWTREVRHYSRPPERIVLPPDSGGLMVEESPIPSRYVRTL